MRNYSTVYGCVKCRVPNKNKQEERKIVLKINCNVK